MATIRAWNSTTDPTSAVCATATFRSGNNSAAGGAWEYNVGNQYAQLTWGTVDGNFNNVEMQADFEAPEGGGANLVTFGIDSGPVLEYGGRTYSTIHKVGFNVSIDGSSSVQCVKWLSLLVTFYDANDNPDSISVGENDLPVACSTLVESLVKSTAKAPAGAATTKATTKAGAVDANTTVSAKIVSTSKVIEPANGFVPKRVVVSGLVHMSANVATPGQSALVGKIWVWTDACAAT
ncbi:MAG TPA: hypothetical protein VK986_21615 [Tepidisphaeraceae bacterium]|nr:hypothetical protein [Tepidisphaeraceae bacterium]